MKELKQVPLEKWVETTRRLLLQEKDEEIQTMQEELQTLSDLDNPNVLVNLKLVQFTTALFGRTMLKLAFPSVHLRRPKPHQFTVGDLVQLRLKQKTQEKTGGGAEKANKVNMKLPTGIVARVEETSISVALGDDQDVDEEELLAQSITLDRLVNNATFVKITSALDQLAKYDYGTALSVVEIVFSGKTPSWNTPLPEITPFTEGLNDSQIEAIRFALASKDIALIHGPPGTGKTTTVVEFILQAVKNYKMKVLVCAPSNIAVDNVLEKLANHRETKSSKMKLTRIGHPARVLPQIMKYCLDAKIEHAEGTEIVNDIRKEIVSMHSKLQRTRDKSLRFNLRREMKANRKEIRVREQNVVMDLVKHSDVICATNVGASSKLLKDVTFDLVVIDEAAQALEASCWIPILKANRCVLAGDHLQLPPTIKSKTAASEGLEITLFDRITRFSSTQCVVKMLNIQYRMHEAISNWSSAAMYNSELKNFEGVAKRKLHELPHVTITEDDELLNATLLLLDTAGCELEEDQDDDDDSMPKNNLLKLSKSNKGEARVVEKHVRALLQSGLREEEVAVITPYNKQVQLLKGLLLESFPKLEIRSVDGFQGCEKEAVVMSLVRSNSGKEVGFLADDRRMNVAITRAKRHVAVVCDTETISSHKFLDILVKHFEEFGEYRSAQEYLDEDLIHGSVTQSVSIVTKSPSSNTVANAFSNTKIPAFSSDSDIKVKPQATQKKIDKKADEAMKMKTKDEPKQTTTITEEEVSAGKVTITSTTDEKPKPTAKELEAQAIAREDSESEDAAVADVLEEKSKSVFQMLSDSSDSESSDDTHEKDGDVTMKHSASPSSTKDDDLTSANSLLKDLHLSRLARQPPPPPSTSTGSGSKSKKNKKKKKKNETNRQTLPTTGTVPVGNLKVGEDELEFLTRQASTSTRCSFQGTTRCKKSTSMLSTVCRFCKLKFCFDHGLPEAHGCGDAVRQFERAQFQQQMSRPVDQKKPLTADKRKLLKKKLEEKVTEKTAGRTTKTKEKKKR